MNRLFASAKNDNEENRRVNFDNSNSQQITVPERNSSRQKPSTVQVNNFVDFDYRESENSIEASRSPVNSIEASRSPLLRRPTFENVINDSLLCQLIKNFSKYDQNKLLLDQLEKVLWRSDDEGSNNPRKKLSQLDYELENCFKRLETGIHLIKYNYTRKNEKSIGRHNVFVKLSQDWKSLVWKPDNKVFSKSVSIETIIGVSLGANTLTFKLNKAKIDAKDVKPQHDDDMWISIVWNKRTLDLVSTERQDLYDIWMAISHSLHLYSPLNGMRKGNRQDFVVKMAKIKILQMQRQSKVSLVELFLWAMLKSCMTFNDNAGKMKIIQILEKRTHPLQIFIRRMLRAPQENPHLVRHKLGKQSRQAYKEQIRKEVLSARRFYNLNSATDAKFYQTGDLSNKSKSQLAKMQAICIVRRQQEKRSSIHMNPRARVNLHQVTATVQVTFQDTKFILKNISSFERLKLCLREKFDQLRSQEFYFTSMDSDSRIDDEEKFQVGARYANLSQNQILLKANPCNFQLEEDVPQLWTIYTRLFKVLKSSKNIQYLGYIFSPTYIIAPLLYNRLQTPSIENISYYNNYKKQMDFKTVEAGDIRVIEQYNVCLIKAKLKFFQKDKIRIFKGNQVSIAYCTMENTQIRRTEKLNVIRNKKIKDGCIYYQIPASWEKLLPGSLILDPEQNFFVVGLHLETAYSSERTSMSNGRGMPISSLEMFIDEDNAKVYDEKSIYIPQESRKRVRFATGVATSPEFSRPRRQTIQPSIAAPVSTEQFENLIVDTEWADIQNSSEDSSFESSSEQLLKVSENTDESSEISVEPLVCFNKSAIFLTKQNQIHVYNPVNQYYQVIYQYYRPFEQGASMAVYKNRLIITGLPKLGRGTKRMALIVDVDQSVTALQTSAFEHSYHRTIILCDVLYLVSGIQNNKVEKLHLLRVDTETLKQTQWSKSKALQESRHKYASAVYKSTMFIAGGISGPEMVHTNSIDRYIEGLGWRECLAVLPEFISNGFIINKNGKGFLIFGGELESGKPNTSVYKLRSDGKHISETEQFELNGEQGGINNSFRVFAISNDIVYAITEENKVCSFEMNR